MSEERLSKLQRIILAVLKAKDEVDDQWYKKYRPNYKSPYWHRLRDTYGDGDSQGNILEWGVKQAVKRYMEKLLGIRSILEVDQNEWKPNNYFDKSLPTGKQSRFGYEIYKDIAPFNVSFCRSVRGLIGKGYIEAKITGRGQQVAEVRLLDKGLIVKLEEIKLNNKNNI